MEIIYLIIIFLLVGFCVYLFLKQKKQNQIFTEQIEENQSQAAATLERTNQSHKTEYEKLEYNLKEKHNADLEKLYETFEGKISDRDKYIKLLKKFSINRGEVETHNILQELKGELIEQGLIKEGEMIIAGNLFVPFWEESNLRTRQIDHLVLLPTGIYVIETKHWAGTVLHGVTKNNHTDNTLSVLLESMFSSYEQKKEQTISIRKTLNKDRKVEGRSQLELRLLSYGNPSMQVMETAMKLRALLIENNKRYNYVTPVVYYSYSSDGDNQVINYSTNKRVNVCIEREELLTFLKKQLTDEKRQFTSSDLININNILETKNNISR